VAVGTHPFLKNYIPPLGKKIFDLSLSEEHILLVKLKFVFNFIVLA
jgi:hypothetical protein